MHKAHQNFFTRYQKSGYLITYLRNTQAQMRLRGLNRMIEIGKNSILVNGNLPKDLERILLAQLQDSHEGVRARSAFVAGQFDVLAAIPWLQGMAQNDEILREVALFALGEIQVELPADNPAHPALLALSKMNTIQQSSPYALSIALGNQKLFVHDLLWQFYQKHKVNTKDTEQKLSQKSSSEQTKDQHMLEALRIRQASIWALGETRDFKLVDRLGMALQDDDLSIRCLAAYGLEKMVVFESSPYLRTAFEKSNKDEKCMRLETPTQIGEKVHE